MQFFNRRGYTIDQTILIVAIIAILITLVIITLGWTLLSRTSGSKLGSFTDQVSQAINTYYGSKRVFPASIAELNNEGLVKFRYDGTDYFHDIGGSGGKVTMSKDISIDESGYNIGTTTANYIVVSFTDVPAAEANEALKAVNGELEQKGHLVALSAAGSCVDSAMKAKAGVKATATGTVCFVAQKS